MSLLTLRRRELLWSRDEILERLKQTNRNLLLKTRERFGSGDTENRNILINVVNICSTSSEMIKQISEKLLVNVERIDVIRKINTERLLQVTDVTEL